MVAVDGRKGFYLLLCGHFIGLYNNRHWTGRIGSRQYKYRKK